MLFARGLTVRAVYNRDHTACLCNGYKFSLIAFGTKDERVDRQVNMQVDMRLDMRLDIASEPI